MFMAGEHAGALAVGPGAFEVELGGTGPRRRRRGADGLSHNVATPAEVREVLELAGSAGAPVWGPVEREWGGFTGYFADPDGFRWEVAWNPGPIGLRAVPDTDVDARP